MAALVAPERRRRGRRDWHVAVVVENVAAGVDTRLRKQIDDLLTAGFRVSVVTRRSPDNAPYRARPGLRLLEYPEPPEPRGLLGFAAEYLLSFGWAAARLSALRARGRIDVLQLCQPPDIYFPLAWLLRAAGARVVVDQRDLMPELLASRYDGRPPAALDSVLRWLERRTQGVAHHTVTVNDHLRRRLEEAGADPRRISVVRNGPVQARAERAVRDDALRQGHRHLVCWAGKMGPQDRVDLVLRLADRVVNVLGRTDCGFAVLGDGECLDELRRQAGEMGLDRWVHFTDWLPEDQVFSYLVTADLGVDTSLQAEVSPVKAMEYMGCGLPVVSFDLPETRRITDGAGALAPAGDEEALARALVDLLDDPDRRAALGAAGRTRVRDWLSWERQSPEYVRVVGPRAHSARPAEEPRTPVRR
jgi:glycosyltransferase involved in cell wall biosynthesis